MSKHRLFPAPGWARARARRVARAVMIGAGGVALVAGAPATGAPGPATSGGAAKLRPDVSKAAAARPALHLHGRPVVLFLKEQPTAGFRVYVRFTTEPPRRTAGGALVGMSLAGLGPDAFTGAVNGGDPGRDCFSDFLEPAKTGVFARPASGQRATLIIDIGTRRAAQQIPVRVRLRAVGRYAASYDGLPMTATTQPRGHHDEA